MESGQSTGKKAEISVIWRGTSLFGRAVGHRIAFSAGDIKSVWRIFNVWYNLSGGNLRKDGLPPRRKEDGHVRKSHHAF
jgi:hypothetical protein